jgi:hypothetical protein
MISLKLSGASCLDVTICCSFDFHPLKVHPLKFHPSSLPQAESTNAELSLLVNKLHSEEAALQDSLAKMGSMNEGLAQDKSDLNSIICQVRHSGTNTLINM